MSWRESLRPVAMRRVALVAPTGSLRGLLVEVADAGTVDLDVAASDDPEGHREGPAQAVLQRMAGEPASPALAPGPPDLEAWEHAGRADLVAGEAELERAAEAAVTRGSVSALVGWMAQGEVEPLADRVALVGGAVVPMAPPPGVQPPTMLAQEGASKEFAPLVETYATVPYADVNPSILAGLAYVVMFGMMFADVGHGALLLLAAVAVRAGWWSTRLGRLRPVWLFLAGAGAASMVFGALYGEFFGPTGVIPVIWIEPLEHPVELLGVAVGVGAVLLAGAYALGTVNRFREAGWRGAVYAPTGMAGSAVFLGLGAVVGGVYSELGWLTALGVVLGAAGLVVAAIGLYAAAGGGGAAVAETAVELFDLVIRLGSNLVSFARLAAFGLTHAALGLVIWQGTTALWDQGGWARIAAVVVFVVGNALAFGLEGLVAAIQALRLEYYELFSRVFEGVGRPFRPWRIPLDRLEAPCSPG
jgi:V/A-type H+/Na+-transporting ATPase subunit I